MKHVLFCDYTLIIVLHIKSHALHDPNECRLHVKWSHNRDGTQCQVILRNTFERAEKYKKAYLNSLVIVYTMILELWNTKIDWTKHFCPLAYSNNVLAYDKRERLFKRSPHRYMSTSIGEQRCQKKSGKSVFAQPTRTNHHQVVANHIMMTPANGNIFSVTGPLWGESTRHRWITLTITSDVELLLFSLMCARTNGGTHIRAAGDFRRHAPYCDVSVMLFCLSD